MNDAPIQILLVEDNPDEAALLRVVLGETAFGRFTVTHVSRLADALARLDRERFDVVLLDLGLPDSEGLATIERMHEQAQRMPVVVMTGLADEALAVRAMQEGAQDYLVKGEFTGNTLARAVRYAIERKRFEETIQAAEQRLTMAVDAAQIGIWAWDVQTGRVSWSHHHARLFGAATEESEGKRGAFEKNIHPDDLPEVRRQVDRSLATREEYHHEFRVVWPDGSVHWIEARGQVICDEKGRPLRMFGTAMDRTRRKAEEEAARLREAELAHLERVSTMGQMASGLAHELNQPLGAILNYSTVCMEQLESGGNGSRQTMRTALQEVMNETRRAGAIISKLRSFVRKQQPQRTAVDVNRLVEDAIGLLDFELRQHGVRPRLNMADGLRKVLADRIPIEQVLVNLLYNALQAMAQTPSALKKLTVETRRDSDGAAVQVRVTDSGCGVNAEEMPRLFEPFFTTKAKGLGMGLNISRSIVESHGGRLDAAPNPDGAGMQFSFTLPTVEGERP